MRYALLAYGASWVFAGCVSLVAWLLFGVHRWGGAGALWFDVAWLASLVPLYRAGVLSAGALGLRPAPVARSAGLALLVFVSATVFDAVWRSALALGSVSNPFSGISGKGTATIVLTGVTAVVSPVVEEVFFRGLLFRCFRNRFALLPASVMIGVMFGLVHTEYPLAVLPELAVYGALLCVLYEYTGSLWPGIALNAYLDAGGFEQALTGRSTVVFWTFVLLALVLVARSLRRTTA
ncbi:MAG TPA: CPBP family intramembrane glutamic endopeptidase [Solirubrobacteraceae bacterium]|nr:CPBP family intramembrane glutamic endopeptidase [Solirubrobacteraceae bacterium]